MNRAVRAAVCAGLGGTFALGLHATFEAVFVSPAEQNSKIEHCAQALGATVTQTLVVPEQCSDYLLSFDSMNVKVNVTDPKSGRNTVEKQEVYILPSADDFRREYGASESDVRSYQDTQRVSSDLANVFGALVGVSFYALPSVVGKLEQRDLRH